MNKIWSRSRRLKSVILMGLLVFFTISACRHDPQTGIDPNGNYPDDVAKIIVTKCGISGCHSAITQNAGVRMDLWEQLWKGGYNGAYIIPYHAELSSLMYFINTDSSRGPVVLPTMPYNDPDGDLTDQEYNLIKDWINMGAPSATGQIPFSENPDTRQKIYLTMQACDLIGVIDAESKVTMRYINVGNKTQTEAPHCVKFDAEGRYAYVSFISSDIVQKIDVAQDKVVGSCTVGSGSWNVFSLSPDGKRLIISDWVANGKMVFINTETMTVENAIGSGGSFVFPHGITYTGNFDTFYVTAQYGNTVYKFTEDFSYYKKISIDGNPPVTSPLVQDPHEIILSPDESKYFLTCEASDEVRVMDAHTDQLIKAIPVGDFPQEFALSKTRPYLFVSCMQDATGPAGFVGSIYVINYETLDVVQVIKGKFYQPHGLTVNDEKDELYISNRNTGSSGIPPHHSSICGGQNGFYYVYSMATFQSVGNKYEVFPEPYSAATRFVK